MVKHLLVPTDGSALSQAAVAWAAAFACKAGARITLVHTEPEARTVYAGVGAVSGELTTQAIGERPDGVAQDALESVARAWPRLACPASAPGAWVTGPGTSSLRRPRPVVAFSSSWPRTGAAAWTRCWAAVLTHTKIPVPVHR